MLVRLQQLHSAFHRSDLNYTEPYRLVLPTGTTLQLDLITGTTLRVDVIMFLMHTWTPDDKVIVTTPIR